MKRPHSLLAVAAVAATLGLGQLATAGEGGRGHDWRGGRAERGWDEPRGAWRGDGPAWRDRGRWDDRASRLRGYDERRNFEDHRRDFEDRRPSGDRRRGYIPPGYGPPPGYGRYGPPPGDGRRDRALRRGGYLPDNFRGAVVDDYRRYRLRPPPHGYAWVRTPSGFALVFEADGRVFDVIPD